MPAQEKNADLGQWTPYGKLTPADRKVFDEAFEGFVGVHYTPETVSTQIVNGTNYRFKSKAQQPGKPEVRDALVEIHKPLNGKAKITKITDI